MMGKTARNERLKIIATFYNNIAVGTLVAGILVPAITLIVSLPMLPEQTYSWEKIEAVLAFAAVAMMAAISVHLSARRIVASIED